MSDKLSSKRSFMLYKDLSPCVSAMTDEQAGKFFKAIYTYQLRGEVIDVGDGVNLLFISLVETFKRDNDKYLDTCAKRSSAGHKGGVAKASKRSKSKQKVANVADKDKDKESDTEKDSDTVNPSGFDEFWCAYPKKKQKQTAIRAWVKKPSNVKLTTIIDAVTRAKVSEDWLEEGGKYIPHPATWLNGGCWDDVHEKTKKYAVEPIGLTEWNKLA